MGVPLADRKSIFEYQYNMPKQSRKSDMRVDRGALARRVRSLRENRRWNQSTLAEQSGVSQPTISQIENAERTPSIEKLAAIASAFEESIEFLVFGTVETREAGPPEIQALFRDVQRLDEGDLKILRHHMSLLLERSRRSGESEDES